VLIHNFPIVNRHQQSHHFLKGKMFVLKFHHAPPVSTHSWVPKPILIPTPIDHMPKFMKLFIEKFVDVKGDGNCGFRAMGEHMGLTEEGHPIICIAFLTEVKEHMSDYMRVFRSEERFNYILNDLYPPQNSSGMTFKVKWLTFSEMGHIVATCNNKVVVELTNHKIGISKTFFFPN